MEGKHRIILAALATGLISIFVSIIYTENGLVDLLKLKAERTLLKIENSKAGLKLLDNIDYYERLANNDPKLIERLAREQGMIGKDEMVILTGEKVAPPQKAQPEEDNPVKSRTLSEEEYAKLFKFDVDSFPFYEKLEK